MNERQINIIHLFQNEDLHIPNHPYQTTQKNA